MSKDNRNSDSEINDIIGDTRHRHHHEEKHHEHKKYENDLTELLTRTARVVAQKDRHSRGQAKIMVVLSENDGISQRDLQSVLRVSSGTMSEVIKKLEEHSLITRTRNLDDRRCINIFLTEEGKAAADREIELAQQNNIFCCLTDDEQSNLKSILEKLMTSFEK